MYVVPSCIQYRSCIIPCVYWYRQIQCQSKLYCRHPYCPVCITYFGSYIKPSWAGIAQSVMLLYTGWTFRGRIPFGGEISRTRPDRLWGQPSLLYNGYGVFPRGKVAGAWRWPPTPSSAEIKERVELYFYSPSGTSWPVLGWILPLP
jgi:hypothetical protein